MPDRRTRGRPCKQATLDINDLAAAIVGQARHEWEAPNRNDYQSVVCWGDDNLGFAPCQYRWECYPIKTRRHQPRGPRYDGCIYRRNAIRLELIEFWNSPWCEFLMGGVDPVYVRRALGVPTL